MPQREFRDPSDAYIRKLEQRCEDLEAELEKLYIALGKLVGEPVGNVVYAVEWTRSLSEVLRTQQAKISEAQAPKTLDKILVLDSAGRQVTVKELLAEGQAAIGRLAKMERWLVGMSVLTLVRKGQPQFNFLITLRDHGLAAAIDAIEEEAPDA